MKLKATIIQNEKEHLRMLVDDYSQNFPDLEVLRVNDQTDLFPKAKNIPPQVFILDGSIQQSKVLEICKNIKNNSRLAGSKVMVAYSENASPGLPENALVAGADCLLKYPFDAIELKSQLNLLGQLIHAEQKPGKNGHPENNRPPTEVEQRLRTYLDHSPYGVFVANQFGEYTEVNPAACHITGYTEKELLTMQISDLLAPESLEAGIQHFREVSEKGSAYSELQLITKKRKIVWCSIAATKVAENVFLGFKMDITHQKKNILAIEESEMKLKLAMKVARMGYWRIEVATNKVEWSPGHDVLFGIPMEQFRGNLAAVQDCVHPDDRAHGEANLAKAIEEDKPFENYYRVVHPNGEIRWLFSYGILLKDANGDTSQIFGITRDITDEKTAELELTEKNRNNAFLNSLSINLATIPAGEDTTPLIIKSTKEHTGALAAIFTTYNHKTRTYKVKHILTDDRILKQVLKVTGSGILSKEMTLSEEYYRDILKNKIVAYNSFYDITQGQVPEIISKAINKIAGIDKIFGIAHTVEEKFYGGTILAFGKDQKLPSNEFLETYAYLAGISMRRRIAEKELIEAKSKAEKSDMLKTAFIHNINHEIRTPVNSILGFGEILSRADIAPAEKANYFTVFQNSTNRLLQTITDYMDISFIVSGNLSPVKVPFSLSEVIDELKAKAEVLNEKKNLRLHFEFPENHESIQITTDREMLLKALQHLLNNAIKYTNRGSVTAGCKLVNSSVEFYFQDTGKGISPEKMEEIFIPFEKENHAFNSGFEGSGLGLAICKGMATALGGKVHIQSQLNKGTGAFFTIPFSNGSMALNDASAAGLLNQEGAEPLILVAEDIEANFLFAEIILKAAGTRVLHAENGAQAIELCRQHPDISLILMDVKMPVVDGIEATREILKFRKNLPIIAVTAYAKTGKEHLIRAAGCVDILPKPFKKKELLLKISKYIRV